MEYQSQQQSNYEDEIDLRDYINVLRKRKTAILTIVLIGLIVAGIISKTMPKIYETSSLIRMGKIPTIEEPINVQEILLSGAVIKQVNEKLVLENEQKINKNNIDVEIIQKSDLVKIKARAKNPEKSIQIVNTLNEIILNKHNQLFEQHVLQMNNNIEKLNVDVKIYEQEIKKRANVISEGQGRVAESYINLLYAAKKQMKNLNKQLLNTTQTSIEAEPILPKKHILPKTMQNIVIAGILGLFIGIFYAFGAEYFTKKS